ncbi:MAG: hypothetical protein OXI03_02015, partial [Chloroflexota bacterium]|nr:hypothetical protein [Chloroflexota bacterium]
VERLERLEQENRELRREIEALKAAPSQPAPAPVTAAAPGPGTDPPAGPGGLAGTGTDFADRMLDPTRDVNRKDRLVLEARRDGTLAPNAFRLHWDVTAVANWQSSNRADGFACLMRHPTAKNQIGKEVSETAAQSARLAMTATAGDRVTGHAEALFDPGQSFGSGTNMLLERNQLQMRKAWLLFGDLDRSPFHASIRQLAPPSRRSGRRPGLSTASLDLGFPAFRLGPVLPARITGRSRSGQSGRHDDCRWTSRRSLRKDRSFRSAARRRGTAAGETCMPTGSARSVPHRRAAAASIRPESAGAALRGAGRLTRRTFPDPGRGTASPDAASRRESPLARNGRKSFDV